MVVHLEHVQASREGNALGGFGPCIMHLHLHTQDEFVIQSSDT